LVFFNRALTVEPKNASLLNNTGNIYFLKGQYEDAVKEYQKAAAEDPKDALVLVNLAKAFLKLEKTQSAKQALDKACTIDPDVIKSHRSLSLKLLGPG